MDYNFTPFYVIPGNEKEFQDYAHNHTSRLAKIGMVPRIVLFPHDLSSDVNPSGIFIGTWYERKDAWEIVQMLAMVCPDPKKQKKFSELLQIYLQKKNR